MTAFLLAVSTLAIAVVALVVLLPQREASRRRTLIAASRESGLGLTAEVEPEVLRRSRRAQRMSVVGGLLGWTLSTSAVLIHGSPNAAEVWLTMGSIAFGCALGNVVAASVDARTRTRTGRPRLARDSAVSISDYLPPLERRSGWIATAGISVAAAACALAGVRDPLALLGAPSLVALSAGAAAVLSRRIVAAPQRAGSEVELAWDDALRAKNLRALVTAAPAGALYGAVGLLYALVDLDRPGTTWTAFVLVLAGAFVPMLLLQLRPASRNRASARHPLRRLWPRTAAQLDAAEGGAR